MSGLFFQKNLSDDEWIVFSGQGRQGEVLWSHGREPLRQPLLRLLSQLSSFFIMFIYDREVPTVIYAIYANIPFMGIATTCLKY